jgi:apolipoprotein N-acyltransferase
MTRFPPGLRLGLCLAAGAVTPLSLAPFNFWWLAPLCLAVFILALRGDDSNPTGVSRHCFFIAFVFGLGFFAVGASWVYVSIHDYGYAPVPLALCLTGLFVAGLALVFALPFWCYGRFFNPSRLTSILLGFPALWVLGEWLRSWLFTGFPWLYLGYAHLDTPLAAWYPMTGVYGVSWIVALLGAAIACLALYKNIYGLIVVAGFFVAGFLLQSIQWTSFSDTPIRVAIVQPNFSLYDKWNPAKKNLVRNTLADMSRPLWATNDVVLWPEAALSEFYQEAQGFLADMDDVARSHHSTLITGIPYFNEIESQRQGKTIYHNSILALGEGSGLYHKVRLVPFGEYVPLENLLRGLIRFFDLPMSQFSKGKEQQRKLKVQGLPVATYICYEIVYPNLVAHNAHDAAFLVTISNDSWFGDSIGPQQHLQMARVRAAETGRYVIRGTNDGISAIIDPRGKLLQQSERFATQTLKGSIYPASGQTLFVRTGSLPWIIFLFVTLFAVYIYQQKTAP